MNPIRNRVYPLTITTLTPVHVGTGGRLIEHYDFHADSANKRVYVLDAEAMLDWIAVNGQQSDTLQQEIERFERDETRFNEEFERFRQNPPSDRRKRIEQKERFEKRERELTVRAMQLKERVQRQRRAQSALPDLLLSGSTIDQLLEAKLITVDHLAQGVQTSDGRAVVRYVLPGQLPTISGNMAQNEIIVQTKDPWGRAYLPGSALKGALRSVLFWAYAPEPDAYAAAILNSRNAKFAAQELEDATFLGQLPPGSKANATTRDVMRTLRISDTIAVAEALQVSIVRIYRSSSRATTQIPIETITAGQVFSARMQLDRYPFDTAIARNRIDFGAWSHRLDPLALAQAGRDRARSLIESEIAYYERHQSDGLVSNVINRYHDIRRELEALDERSFLLQIGWGTGWGAKTLDSRLRNTSDLFIDVIKRHKLKRHKSAAMNASGEFPQTRRLTQAGTRLMEPLGWVRVRIGEEA